MLTKKPCFHSADIEAKSQGDREEGRGLERDEFGGSCRCAAGDEPVEDADPVHLAGHRVHDVPHRACAARAHLRAKQSSLLAAARVVGRRRGGGAQLRADAGAQAARQGAQGRRHHGRRTRAVIPRQRQAAPARLGR